MTREETVKNLLTELIDMIDNGSQRDLDRADEISKTIIEALSQEPTEKPMTVDEMEREYEKSKALFHKIVECDDAISREAALEAVSEGCQEWRGICGRCEELINALPSVTQKSGKWVEIDDEPHEVWECDHCGFVIDGSGCIEPYEYRDTYKYCPNCGAKMESEVRNEV